MAKRLGSQQPTFEVVGSYESSDGPACVELFGNYGVEFLPSQERELELFLARDDDGRAAAKTIGISKPRQNGKSYGARHYAVWTAAVEGKRVLYTAHHGVTTREMFKLLRNFVEGTPDFAAALAKDGVKRASGAEAVYFANGGCIEFNTRTNSVARGKTYDVIIVDEAQELTDEQADALTPTTLASGSGDPQIIYLGTPPNHKCPGTVFRQLHKKAHDGEAGDSWWLEWAATEVGDPHDVDRWYRCCPAMGYRIREDVMADAADSRSPDGFAREYLGWWSDDVSVEHVVSEQAWRRCKADAPPKGGVLSCAVKFSPDGSEGAIAVCLKPDGGTPHVEVAQARSLSHGIGWARDWLLARRDKLALAVIDGLSAAAALTTELERERYPKPGYAMAKSADVVAACSMFADAVKAGEVTHFGQPDLDAAVTCCGKRRIGNAGGFGFESNDNGDATLAEAAALAYWAAMTTKRRPGRKLRVG